MSSARFKDKHKNSWMERDANLRAYRYFSKHYGIGIEDWYHRNYPIGVEKEINAKWWEYFLTLDLITTLNLNSGK